MDFHDINAVAAEAPFVPTQALLDQIDEFTKDDPAVAEYEQRQIEAIFARIGREDT